MSDPLNNMSTGGVPAPSLTTFWDKAQQLIRKAVDFGTGFLVAKGIIDADLAMTFGAVVTEGANLLWFWWWNRKEAVTISGLKSASEERASLGPTADKLETLKK